MVMIIHFTMLSIRIVSRSTCCSTTIQTRTEQSLPNWAFAKVLREVSESAACCALPLNHWLRVSRCTATGSTRASGTMSPVVLMVGLDPVSL